MDNPFLKEGALGVNASINKLIIAKVPFELEDDIKGKSAMDLFSAKQFIEEMKRKADLLGLNLMEIEEQRLPQYLEICLENPNDRIRETAESIVEKFGQRLALILMTLKKGEIENQKRRNDWGREHWNYWKNIENVILTGGLASSITGRRLKYYYEKTLASFQQDGYSIFLGGNSSNGAISGCASEIKCRNHMGNYVVLDYGQTFIKRSIVTKQAQTVICIKELEKQLSRHVEWVVKEPKRELAEAKALHQFMAGVLVHTVQQAERLTIRPEMQFVLSIANYVNNGVFAYRGGYGKLTKLAENYEVLFERDLQKRLNKPVKIMFIHDGTAMAKAYSGYEKAVCLSLGTAFGVGFPDGKNKLT